MSHWNHRVIKTTELGEDLFAVHEVQYNTAGKPISYTDEAVTLDAMPLSELHETLALLSLATAQPVLTLDDFPAGLPAANDETSRKVALA
jgi:hypothetical protein